MAIICNLVLLASALPAGAASPDAGAQAAMAWLRATAAPIATTSPDADTEDLQPLAAALGDARVVAFGEATHGSHEVFQLKDRLFRYLVTDHGFTAFVIEANYAEADRIDAYVKGGPGDAEALVGGMGFWTWDTEEVLALVRWIRAYNDQHERKVSFYGMDMQFAPSNLDIAFDFLDTVDLPDRPARAPYEAYMGGARTTGEGYRLLGSYPPDTRRELKTDALRLFQYFEVHRAALIESGGEIAYLSARSAALAAAWYFTMEVSDINRRFSGLPLDFDVRDRAMADLVRAALEREGEEGRVFVWAHNSHVSRARHVDERLTMGHFLSQDLGDDFVGVGFAFDRGTFQAFPPRDPALPEFQPRLSEMRVPSAPPDHSEAVLREGPAPIYAVDLRRLIPGTPAHGWFLSRRQLRWTGANYSIELMAKHPPISLAESYDLLIFARDSTRARPNPATRAVQGIEVTW
jgi:erythromycin esterase